MKLAPPIKWHGGKHYLAPKIVKLFPPHLHYVEPYAGGLAVLLAKEPEGVSEVVNDLNGELTNFWSVLQDPGCWRSFHRTVATVPFSEAEFQKALLLLAPSYGLYGYRSWEVERAIAFFIRCRQSLAGRMKSFAAVSRNRTRRGMNEQVAAWLTAVEGLPAVHERLKRVFILNRDALDVIREQDGPQTLFYLDPPYLHETRATAGEYGEYEMTLEQHSILLHVLRELRGKFALSGYRSDLYDTMAKDCRWTRHEFNLPNNAAGGARKRRMVECVWTNFGDAAS